MFVCVNAINMLPTKTFSVSSSVTPIHLVQFKNFYFHCTPQKYSFNILYMFLNSDEPFSDWYVNISYISHTPIGFYIPLTVPPINISLNKFFARFWPIFDGGDH